MRSVGRHVLVVVVAILQYGLFHCDSSETSVVRDEPLTAGRALGHGDRTIQSQRSRGRHESVIMRVPGHKKRQKSDQSQTDLQRLPLVNGTVDTPMESDVQLRKALRQKRRKLKRLWQEIDRIQRALKSSSGSSVKMVDGHDRPRIDSISDVDDGKVKVKAKGRKNHWRRRMMQRLKLLSRQLQEQQQRPLATGTVEKLYALLAMEPASGGKGGSRDKVLIKSGRRQGGRRPKKFRGQQQKQSNSTALAEFSPLPATGRPLVKFGANESGNKTVQQVVTSQRRQLIPVETRQSGKSTAVVNAGRIVVKKGEAGSACTSHKNCKPGFCCHQAPTLKTSTTNGTYSICVEHRLKQEQPCANSCQCDNGLQCFISRKDKLYHKRLPPPDPSSWSSSGQRDEGSGTVLVLSGSAPASGDGQCKIPAMDDVLHGTYIIGDQIFKPGP